MTCAGLAPEPELSEGKRFYSQVAEERLAYDQAAKLDRLKYTVEQAKNAPIYRDRLGGVSISSLDDLRSLGFADFLHNDLFGGLRSNPPKSNGLDLFFNNIT